MEDLDLNQAVFTTTYIIKEKCPILNVYHDSDNDWQFLGNQPTLEKDAMIVSLKEILQYDETIEDILYLPTGFKASREYIGGKWDPDINLQKEE